jgi:hypothetical protein
LGDRVTTGTPLIEFDLDYVALHAKSLLTQVVVANTDRVTEFVRQTGLVQSGQDIFMELVLAEAIAATATDEGEIATSEPIVIPNPDGTARAAGGGAGEPGEKVSGAGVAASWQRSRQCQKHRGIDEFAGGAMAIR